MVFGLQNVTAPNLSSIINIANGSDFPRTLININHEVYSGYFFYALCWTLWIILFFASSSTNKHYLQNAMYSGFVVSLVSLIIRGIEVYQNGLYQGLVTDRQMWIFPLITCLLILVIWITRKREAG